MQTPSRVVHMYVRTQRKMRLLTSSNVISLCDQVCVGHALRSPSGKREAGH